MITDDDAHRATMSLSRCMNALGLLAAPKAWASSTERSGEATLRRGVVESIDEAWREVASVSTPVEVVTGLVPPDLVESLGRLRAATTEWSGGAPPSRLVALARRCLTALGVPEPDDGWELFDADDR